MNINDVELDLDNALEQAVSNIGDKKNKLLQFFGRYYQYSDEPKFFQYSSQYSNFVSKNIGAHGSASGFSFFSQKLAALKCLLEALERFAVNYYKERHIVFSSTKQLDKPYLDISKITSFSDIQREQQLNMPLDLDGVYGWVLGKKLPSLEDIYIPAQIVYLSYIRQKQEGCIRLPITTGAAAGSAYSAAIYRGLCEVIERDAFMITYLNKLPRSRVPLERSKNQEIQAILTTARNYKLKVFAFDISTDLKVYSFLTFVYDNTSISSAISTGLKSGLHPTEALIGSMQEAFHPRTWLRHEKDNFVGKPSELNEPINILSRGLLWSNLKSVRHLNFLIRSNKETKLIEEYENRSEKTSGENLRKVIRVLKDKGYESYFVDITPELPNIKRTHFKIVMTVIPELQPLYLDERYKYFGGKRLYDVPVNLGYLRKPNLESSLNKFPHPFL